MLLSQKLIEEISNDMKKFDILSLEQQSFLSDFIVNQNVSLTDEIFEKLANQENIDEIRSNIGEIIPFLIRFGNLIVSNDEPGILSEFIDKGIFINKYSKENLNKIFGKNSNFIKSIEINLLNDDLIDDVEIKNYNNITSLKYGVVNFNAKITLNTNKNKNIDFILDFEALDKLIEKLTYISKELKEISKK